jgi:hypothetical protein
MRRTGKFNARRTFCDGYWFASGKEAKRWADLRLLEKAGEIRDLRRQVPYVLTARIDHRKASHAYGFPMEDEHAAEVGRYVVDFEYFDIRADVWVFEDVKGFRTPLYKWKARHFAAQYGRKILET